MINVHLSSEWIKLKFQQALLQSKILNDVNIVKLSNAIELLKLDWSNQSNGNRINQDLKNIGKFDLISFDWFDLITFDWFDLVRLFRAASIDSIWYSPLLTYQEQLTVVAFGC